MKETNNNPIAGYIEAQMAGTAGIVQAAMQGMQRVQEIMLRAMREGAGEQMALARSVTQVRDASDLSRVGEAHAGPAAEQFTRYQQELIGAVTAMNTGMIQASYSMIERVGQALTSSAGAMGLPASAQAGGPMAAFQAGMRQWQGAVEQMTRVAQGQQYEAAADEEDEDEVEVEEPDERPSRKASAKRPGRR
jgi:hypothetical protein